MWPPAFRVTGLLLIIDTFQKDPSREAMFYLEPGLVSHPHIWAGGMQHGAHSVKGISVIQSLFMTNLRLIANSGQ